MGKACSAYGEKEKGIQDLGGGTWGNNTTWETQT